VLKNGVVYFANGNDTLVAASAETGKVLWTHHRTPAAGMEVAGYSGPAEDGGLVYMGFSDGTATAFDAVTGEERWQPVDLATEAEEALGEPPKYLDVDTTPVVFSRAGGPAVVFGSYAGGVYCFDAELGTMLWSNTDAVGVSDVTLWTQPPYVRDGVERPARALLLVSSGTTGLWALDPESGLDVWRREVPFGGLSAPAFVDGAILVNSSQLGTFLLSPIDGSLIDGLHFDLGASSTPAAHGRRAFVLTNGGTLLALDVNVPGTYLEPPHYDRAGASPFGTASSPAWH
jgi:outer membrane protein assembly factor BamB